MQYEFLSVNDLGVIIQFSGYSDKILEFAEIYLDTLLKYA